MVDLEWPHWIQPYDVWVGHPPKLPLDRLLLLCGILWLSAGARFIRRQIGNALSRMFIFMDDRTMAISFGSTLWHGGTGEQHENSK